jgi:Uma2 family endonuclease
VRNFPLEVELPSLEPFRLTTDRYHRMIDAGILREDDNVELLNGLLVKQMPRGINHRYTIELLAERLLSKLGPAYSVPMQLPIHLADGTEPEPNLVVTLPRSQRGRGHPTAEQIFLVIEVAETSLKADRTDKLAIYPRAGLPEYWIVNIPEKQVEVYTQPDRDSATYAQTTIYKPGDALPVIVNGVTYDSLPVADLF